MKKRILYICPSPKVMGGISAVVNGYLAAGIERDYKIIIVPSHVDGTKARKFVAAALGLMRAGLLLMAGRVDIVHIHAGDFPSPKRKYFFYKLAKLFRRRIVFHLHGAMFIQQFDGLSRAWQARIIEMFDNSNVVVCLSESWRDSVKKLSPGANMVVLPNAVLMPVLKPARERPAGAVNITFLGLIGDRKGTFDLVEAFDRLVREGLNATLSIGGNGEVERLRNEIAKRGIGDRLKYLGWITGAAKNELMRRTDIYALPSYGEGMPMSVLEAMSYGIAVVSTRVGGVPELVADGETGYLVEPGDIQALTVALRKLAVNPKARENMGCAGRGRVAEHHDVNKAALKVASIYDGL